MAAETTYPRVSRGSLGRRVASGAFRGGTLLALLAAVVPAIWMVLEIVLRALPNWRWDVLTTPTQGTTGGLENAILGTLVIMAGVFLLAGTVGVLSGMYLAGVTMPATSKREPSGIARFATEILAGFPSIVLGYCGYVALVVGLHWGYSLLPALIILSIMVIPYIAKTTEVALRQVPPEYREGADALGLPTGFALRRVVVKSALPGIVTGILVALAIAGGETAPLLLTGGWTNELPKTQLTHQPIAYLTYPVWTFYNQPSSSAHHLAYDAALLLVVLVLALLVTARLLVARTQRHSAARR